MKYVYSVVEKSEDSNSSLEEDFVVYASFEKAVAIVKELLKQEFEYIESSYDDLELQQDISINADKEICEGGIYNEDEVIYSISVKKVPLIY